MTRSPAAAPAPAMFWDRTGRPLTLLEWRDLRGDPDYRFLARDNVAERTVITAWTGVDEGDDPAVPLIFGTIIFDRATATFDDTSERFAATETDARANHARALAAVRGG